MKGTTVKRGKVWYFTVDVGPDPATGKRRKKWVSRDENGQPFRLERDAAAGLRRYLQALEDGGPVEQSGDTLRAFVEDTWLPMKKSSVRPNAYLSLEQCMARTLPRIGALKLRQITPKHVGDLYADLLANGRRGAGKSKSGQAVAGRPLSARTVATTGKVLRQALDDAVRLGMMSRNPAAVVERPKPVAVEMKTWSMEQAQAFMASIDGDRLEALWVLALTSGMRRGEALGLKWSDLDTERGTVSIQRALVEVDYAIQWSEPKTAKSRRVVKLDDGTLAALKAHRKRQAAERLAIGEGYRDEGLIFCSVAGEPLQPQSVSGAFERLAKRAGVPVIRLHDARHTSATVALAQGVPLKVVSERLGHSSTSITSDIYQHVSEHMQTDAAERIGGAFFGTQGSR